MDVQMMGARHPGAPADFWTACTSSCGNRRGSRGQPSWTLRRQRSAWASSQGAGPLCTGGRGPARWAAEQERLPRRRGPPSSRSSRLLLSLRAPAGAPLGGGSPWASREAAEAVPGSPERGRGRLGFCGAAPALRGAWRARGSPAARDQQRGPGRLAGRTTAWPPAAPRGRAHLSGGPTERGRLQCARASDAGRDSERHRESGGGATGRYFGLCVTRGPCVPRCTI